MQLRGLGSCGPGLDTVVAGQSWHWVPREQAEPVLDAVGAAIDRLGGSFVMQYVTTTVTTVSSG